MKWRAVLIGLWKNLHCGGREEWISGNHAPQEWKREREGCRERERNNGGEKERSPGRSLNNLLKIVWNMTELFPAPYCRSENEKSQESLCLISCHYGWNYPVDSDMDYLWFSRIYSQDLLGLPVVWPLATAGTCSHLHPLSPWPPHQEILLKCSSLTSLLKCHSIRKTSFPGHLI